MTKIRFFIVSSVVVVTIAVVAWLSMSRIVSLQPVPPHARFTVAATIFPLADMVRQVAGNDVDVVLIVPPGASPHSYDLFPQQVAQLGQARVIFQIGSGLDNPIVDRAVNATAGGSTVEAYSVGDGIELHAFQEHPVIPGAHDSDGDADLGVDPHYWLSVPNAKIMVRNIAQKLSQVDSAHAATYQANADRYEAQLDTLESDLKTEAAQVQQPAFIAVHNAWSYFAQAYGLQLVGTFEPVEGREPSPRDIQQLQAVVARYGLRTFYTEPQKASTSATQFFHDELGMNVSILDPIGGTNGRDSYISMMQANMAAIVAQ